MEAKRVDEGAVDVVENVEQEREPQRRAFRQEPGERRGQRRPPIHAGHASRSEPSGTAAPLQ